MKREEVLVPLIRGQGASLGSAFDQQNNVLYELSLGFFVLSYSEKRHLSCILTFFISTLK